MMMCSPTRTLAFKGWPWALTLILMTSMVMGCPAQERGAEPAPTAQEGSAANPAGAPASAANAVPQATPSPDPSAAAPSSLAAKTAARLTALPDPTIVNAPDPTPISELSNDAFRDQLVAFVRAVVAGGATVTCTLQIASAKAGSDADAAPVQAPFRAIVRMYRRGTLIGRGEASDEVLCVALKTATRQARASAGGAERSLEGVRFGIELADRDYAVIEYQDRGFELVHELVPVRVLDRALLRQRIDDGKAYLLRVIDPKHKGVHKYYRAREGQLENQLHTIYTASTVYTLLRLYALDRDPEVRQAILDSGEFLLRMQTNNPALKTHGGFPYWLDLTTGQPRPRWVVGTTSKTIFTLIELRAFTKDARYLAAAELAANWLLTMIRPDGSVYPYRSRDSDGTWKLGKGESMLYTGQVLSALSRLHTATDNQVYLDGASKIAQRLTDKVTAEGCYVGDDYRKPNPISSSWVVLALFDFARASGNKPARTLAYRCADDLLTRQIDNRDDVYRYGRWQGSLSSSGNGWLAEVMSELYLDCRARKQPNCQRFEGAILRVIRLVLQYSYTPENSFLLIEPEAAHGGVFWNVADRYVRTDSVCHALNAFIMMLGVVDPGPLVTVPEPSLAIRLGLTPASAESAAVPDDESAPEGAPQDDE